MHPIFPRLKTLILAVIFLLASTPSIAADDEGWTEFSFDSSSENYTKKGERAYDLREGRHVAYEYTKSHSGDFIIMISYSPERVVARTPDCIRILFSTSEGHDAAADQRVGQVADRVSVHYGDSYVASFEGRTYTIKLVEGGYEFPAGKATFLYRPGGTPGPEHEPGMRSATKLTGGSAREDADRRKSRPSDLFADSPGGDEERVDKLTVTVKTGPPEDEANPQKSALKLVLNYRYEDGAGMLSREHLTFREGETRDFTFRDVLAATYDANVSYRGTTIERKVDVRRDDTRVTLAFPGAEEWERRKSEQKSAARAGICESGCDETSASGRPRPVDKRGAPEPVEGYVRFIYVCVATPSADNVSIEDATLTVELKGPKTFRLTRQKIRPGTVPKVKFFTFPVGTYEVIAKYAGETVSDTVELQGDCVDIELAFPGADLAQMSSPKKEAKRIDEVTITIRTPPPAGHGSPEFKHLTLTLNAIYAGGFATMHRDDNAVRAGSVETYTFENVRPGRYRATITYGGKTITDTVEISEANKDIEFVFE